MLGQDAERSAREALRTELGLDQPLWLQYASWLARVAQGDLGRSIRAQQPVRDLIVEKLPATLLLTTTATPPPPTPSWARCSTRRAPS